MSYLVIENTGNVRRIECCKPSEELLQKQADGDVIILKLTGIVNVKRLVGYTNDGGFFQEVPIEHQDS